MATQTIDNCCGGGGGVDSNCCGPFALGVPGTGWSSCCDNVCPPPICCCGSVGYQFDCGGFGSGPVACVPVEISNICPPPCDPSTDPPVPSGDPPSFEPPSADPSAIEFFDDSLSGQLSYGLEDLPGIPDFTSSYKSSNDDFVFALDSCSVPCTAVSVSVSFSGCCLYVDGCNVTTVGSGTLTWNIPSIAGCTLTVTVNGDSSGSLDVPDGTSVTVSVSGDGSACCECQLKSQTSCGIADRKSVV